jgi:hypothetical protein
LNYYFFITNYFFIAVTGIVVNETAEIHTHDSSNNNNYNKRE